MKKLNLCEQIQYFAPKINLETMNFNVSIKYEETGIFSSFYRRKYLVKKFFAIFVHFNLFIKENITNN